MSSAILAREQQFMRQRWATHRLTRRELTKMTNRQILRYVGELLGRWERAEREQGQPSCVRQVGQSAPITSSPKTLTTSDAPPTSHRL